MSIEKVLEVSDEVTTNRTLNDVLNHVMQEVGELSTEIAIVNGTSHKEPSVDGILGEGVDVIVAVLDIIRLACPDATTQDIEDYMVKKATKWKNSTK